ncbi:MAG: response regulator [Acidobacteriota bacterium]|nr:response regulator [Acidobacteriota bacterium]MDQ7088839.1 response regulator [Acidobacteriota bacterium]
MARILIVDDEANLRLLYRKELEELGYQVLEAGTAEEGVALFTREQPDLVVLDVRMPGMNGLEAMARILDRDRRVPIILNTAFDAYRDDFTSWAADAYVTKGPDTTELKQKIGQLLEERSHVGPPEL